MQKTLFIANVIKMLTAITDDQEKARNLLWDGPVQVIKATLRASRSSAKSIKLEKAGDGIRVGAAIDYEADSPSCRETPIWLEIEAIDGGSNLVDPSL